MSRQCKFGRMLWTAEGRREPPQLPHAARGGNGGRHGGWFGLGRLASKAGVSRGIGEVEKDAYGDCACPRLPFRRSHRRLDASRPHWDRQHRHRRGRSVHKLAVVQHVQRRPGAADVRRQSRGIPAWPTFCCGIHRSPSSAASGRCPGIGPHERQAHTGSPGNAGMARHAFHWTLSRARQTMVARLAHFIASPFALFALTPSGKRLYFAPASRTTPG